MISQSMTANLKTVKLDIPDEDTSKEKFSDSFEDLEDEFEDALEYEEDFYEDNHNGMSKEPCDIVNLDDEDQLNFYAGL